MREPVDRSFVAYPGQCCLHGWCYLPERTSDEVHNLARDPSRYGLPLVAIGRGSIEVDIWSWWCCVPGCSLTTVVDVPGPNAWPVALSAALTHLREEHGS